ncbi:dTDP-4-dehydrorhamnose reductase [Oceanobacter mangrovi]|uniref:dTDP-4-dehydrorhamnose reductase n=1 Tax=Oceanobacter mangrovi TaxID=2862510 RepID=UPI001C8D240A|nr:dTDP-4-dehydrorhamnose reductase [Oceanobacter mangrovi]
MRWLITGANGQLGQCMARLLSEQQQDFRALSSAELDITDTVAVNTVLSDWQPDVVINAAAYTAVDRAESEPEKACAVNELGPRLLAEWCHAHQTQFVHVSTDYVFSGDSRVAWAETDATGPQSVYGASKLAGEQAVLAACPDSVILRTAWVFSEFGNNFVKTMIRLAAERDSLSVVSDQIGCPTYAGDIAEAIYQLVTAGYRQAPEGIYHYAGDIAVSWWSFAREIHRQAFDAGLIPSIPALSAIPGSEYPTPAKRPAFSVLNCERINQLGIPSSNWQQSLEKVISRL